MEKKRAYVFMIIEHYPLTVLCAWKRGTIILSIHADSPYILGQAMLLLWRVP